MAAYRSFAVIGAGSLGMHVVNELLKQNNISLKILTRDDTKPAFAAHKASGAMIVKVDYANEDELKSALSGVQVVVSVIGPFGLEAQVNIAKAAKVAGVQLFVPAEFGVRLTVFVNHFKKVVQDALKEIDLPYTLFHTGFFADVFHGVLGFDYAGGKIRVAGSGDVAFGMTSRLDVARFVAHALTTAKPSDLAWARISIESDRKSPKEIAAIAENKFGKPIQIEHLDLVETRKNYNTDFIAFFMTVIADGDGVAGPTEDVKASIAKFYPDWNPAPIDEFIQL